MSRLVLRNGLLTKFSKSIFFCNQRNMSASSGTMTDLKIDEEKGYATLTLKNKAANALATPLMQEMSQAIDEVEKSKCRGLVLTSSIKNIFCSGLNLVEFGGPQTTRESVREYYSGFQDLWLQIFKSPLFTIAAMNGHAIAGGCAIGMACDYRILCSPKFGFGMNEIIFGVAVPYPLLDVMISLMGRHEAAKAAMLGKIFTADEAMKVGLVDESCSLQDIEGVTEKIIKQYLQGNRQAQVASKIDSRQTEIERFIAVKEKDLNRVVATAFDPEAQKVMFAYVEAVTKGKK